MKVGVYMWQRYRRLEDWVVSKVGETRHVYALVRFIAAAVLLVVAMGVAIVVFFVLPLQWYANLILLTAFVVVPIVLIRSAKGRRTRRAIAPSEPDTGLEPPRRLRSITRSKDYERVREEVQLDKILYDERPHFLYLISVSRWVPVAVLISTGLTWAGVAADFWYLFIVWLPTGWYTWRCWCKWAYRRLRMTYRETMVIFDPPALSGLDDSSPSFPSDLLHAYLPDKPAWLRLLFMNCTHLTLDTQVQEDQPLHHMRYVKDPKRVKQAYDILREHYHPAHVKDTP